MSQCMVHSNLSIAHFYTKVCTTRKSRSSVVDMVRIEQRISGNDLNQPYQTPDFLRAVNTIMLQSEPE